KEKLTADPDSEIATTSLRVSLLCPLGKMRLTVPCRAVTCSHLQCFDAALYLQMNEKKPSWICPVCDKNAAYENLIIDGWREWQGLVGRFDPQLLRKEFCEYLETQIKLFLETNHKDDTSQIMLWETLRVLYEDVLAPFSPRRQKHNNSERLQLEEEKRRWDMENAAKPLRDAHNKISTLNVHLTMSFL
ncbi:hypothetical protein ILYODFUR_017642, partial [Ilyodon furcidens]